MFTKTRSNRIAVNDLQVSAHTMTEVEASNVKGGGGPAAVKAVTWAFGVGWAIGTYLNKQFGLSDKLADAAHNLTSK